MKIFKLTFLVLFVGFYACENPPADAQSKTEYVLVIHGGAGTILKENMSAESETAYIEKLNEALEVGENILKDGGASLDAITATIMVMENSPLFNAGKGAVFSHYGTNEMDASIMEGRQLEAGAITGVRHIKNPILGARAVMEETNHVMLTGDGAEELAVSAGLEMVDTSYFFTESRWKSYLRAKDNIEKFGTVGAVALDKNGNLAAGTSTGGMTYKMKGRVGDSPIIGAGTYADNNTCAISATGHGEYFIRNVVAYDISALMKYKKMTLQQATDEVIMRKLKLIGGDGGVVAVDKGGHISMTFNTAGMYRGFVTSNGERNVLIYQDN